MIAFIIAGLVFAGTCAICLLMLFAAGMSDSPSAAKETQHQTLTVFVVGAVVAAVIAATHWLHMSW